jgi:TetR/AcrR family transcriptional repressor of nem operon
MAVGRPKTFDPDVALQSALEHFWSHGYDGTSLQDLLDCTGLSKSSLYEEFGSKHALFERCLDAYREGAVAAMSERLAAAPTGLDFICHMLESATREPGPDGQPRGCLVMNTASEFSQRDRAVARLVSESIAAFTGVFRRAVKRAQAEGDIPHHKNPTHLARFVVANMSGLRTLAKGGASPRALRAAARVAVDALTT